VANYSCNFQGRLSQAQIDSDGDGTTDTTITYEYNAQGIRVCKAIDGHGSTRDLAWATCRQSSGFVHPLAANQPFKFPVIAGATHTQARLR